jgi:CheY-like chemotaxis protein
MVHVRPETMETPWLAAGTAELQKPLVLVGAREHLLALDIAVQSRAREFLIDGWQPEEALMRLRFALPSFVPAEGPPPAPGASPEAISPEVKPMAPAEPASPVRVEAAPLDGSGPDVLIADDDEDIRNLVQTVLKSRGMNCLTASTGTEALWMVHRHRPRAVILDVNIPGMDGFQLLAEIRRENLPARVIMLTGRQQERDIIRGFELGADDYVVKPFNPRELALRIGRLL